MSLSTAVPIACAVIAAVVYAMLLRHVPRTRFVPAATCATNSIALHVSGESNPSLIVEALIGDHPCLFMLDTGYAGMPSLSLPMLVCEKRVSPHGTIDQRVAACVGAVNTYRASHAEQERALRAFMEDHACVEYASGCLTRLMGIGVTAESASAMLLCPAIRLRATDGAFSCCRACASLPEADVLGTSRARALHILTIDFLLHVGPCMLLPEAGELRVALGAAEYMRERPSFTKCSSEFSGGSFVATLTVGGAQMRCTVDTGASTYISLSSSAAARVRDCSRDKARRVMQVGVNGEQVCSDVVLSEVELCGERFQLPVLLNNLDLQDVDGYCGLALLRAFDMLLTPAELALRRNGHEIDTDAFERIVSDGACGEAPACARHA